MYADASPDLWDGLNNAVTTARTLNDQRATIDAALMAAIGFSNTAPTASSAADPISCAPPRICCRTTNCSTTTAP